MQANSQQQRPQGQSQQTQEQRQQVLRQQQQRLLLLRHASKCPHGETNVTVTQENHSEERAEAWPELEVGRPGWRQRELRHSWKKRSNQWTIVTWENTRQEREYRIGSENAHDLVFGAVP